MILGLGGILRRNGPSEEVFWLWKGFYEEKERVRKDSGVGKDFAKKRLSLGRILGMGRILPGDAPG